MYSEEELTVSIPNSFTCTNHTPSQSDFQVEPDDVILACIDGDSPLDVLAESASGYQVYASTSSDWSCDNDIPSYFLTSNYEQLSNFAIHVYAGKCLAM